MAAFIFVIIMGCIACFACVKDEQAIENGRYHADHYGGKTTIWSFIFYFAMVFLLIGLCALFNV